MSLSRFTFFSRRVALALVAAAAFATGAGRLAAAQGANGETIVELPPMMVEEDTKPLKWRFASMPNFEMLTVCSDRQSRDFAEHFFRLEQLLRLLVPDKYAFDVSVPTIHILFEGDNDRALAGEIAQEMIDRERAKGAEPGPEDQPMFSRRGMSTPSRGNVRFMPNMRLVDRDSTAVFIMLKDSAAVSDFAFTPDRFAYQLERRTPSLPPWLLEGLEGLYIEAQFPDDEIHFKATRWLDDSTTYGIANDPDTPRALLPMADLFAVTRSERIQGTRGQPGLWRAQAKLFVRWVYSTGGEARRAALWKFTDRLEREPLSEDLFRECFGLGYADVRDRLSDYLPKAVSESFSLKAGKMPPMPELDFRPATDDEIGRMRGEWERLEISHVRRQYPELVSKYADRALRTLQRGYDRGQKDPRLLAVFGLCEVDAGNKAKATELLQAAVHGGVVRPKAYYALAALRYDAWTHEGKPDVKLTGEQAAELLLLLDRASQQAPELPEVYGLMFEVWQRSDSTPTAADLKVFARAGRLFSNIPAIVTRAILLMANNGEVGIAQELVALGRAHAPDAASVARYDAISARLTAVLAAQAKKKG